MDGIAQRLEQDGAFNGNLGAHFPGNTGRNGDVLGESAVHVDAEDAQVFADVGVAGAAGAADAAEDMAFDGNDFADRETPRGGGHDATSPTISWPRVKGVGKLSSAQESQA